MIKNYTVKNLVVNVYIDNGAVYNEESNKYTHSMMPRVDGSDPLGFYSRFFVRYSVVWRCKAEGI